MIALLAIALAASELRPEVGDLAYAMGEAHALRQACRGGKDGWWRERMAGVLKAEAPPEPQRLQLVARFNAGFAAGKAAHPACDEPALETARARAAGLARTLAKDAR